MAWAALITLSAGLAALLLWLHAPAALMLGPLVAAIVVASNGGKVRMPLTPFVLAQGIVGCLIAKMVPLSIVGDVLRHWFLFSVGVLAVVAISTLIGWLMTRWQVLPGTTALWGTSPGAASSGGKARIPLTPFVLAQGIVGCLIAKMVPLSIVGDVLRHWFLFSVGVLAVVAISTLIGWLMTRWQVLPGTTALWGTSPGAAS